MAIARRVTPEATLSIGWNIAPEYFPTVPASKSTSLPLPLAYDDADVRRMRDALIRNGVSTDASITFAIWSKFISGSLATLRWLTEEFPRSTVTIWGKGPDATVDQVATIYDFLPRSRVFVDLPQEMRDELLTDGR